ncbi:hypothetical protein ACL6C3_16860 [Capilliphycus salinus ALCB114379]|uniref:hypothetical protein n=1 Tax=Capilliphycus salinus TaxID=2768948 RepID=UPI0039A561B3
MPDAAVKAEIDAVKAAYAADTSTNKSPRTASGYADMWIDLESGTKTKFRVPARIILLFDFSEDKSNGSAKKAVFGKKKKTGTGDSNVRNQKSDLITLTGGQAIGKVIYIPLKTPLKEKRGTKEVTVRQTSLRVPQVASRDAVSLFLKLNCDAKKAPVFWFTEGKKSKVIIPDKLDAAALGNIKSIRAEGETAP